MRIRIFDDRGEYMDTFDGDQEDASQRLPEKGVVYFSNSFWMKIRVLCLFCKGSGIFPSPHICEHCNGNGRRWGMHRLTDDDPRVQGLYTKAVKAEQSKPHGKCSCGEDLEFVYVDGMWLSTWSVWDGGMNFGKPSYADCCRHCHDKKHKQWGNEERGWLWQASKAEGNNDG